jgi:hypothetical protein
MKLLRIVTCMTSFGLLVACASVHGPRDSGLNTERQAIRERMREAMFDLNRSPGLRAASTTECSGLGELDPRYYASGLQWRYKSSSCNRIVDYGPTPFLNSTPEMNR